jgi:acylphosphatase
MTDPTRMHVIVRGRVQGVGFRYFVTQAARARDLAGWVLNRPDGAVQVEASGSDASIAAFLLELQSGPRGARVDTVEHLPATGEASLARPFTIRHA